MGVFSLGRPRCCCSNSAMPPGRRAVIDVGTNSVKLLIAEISNGEVQPTAEEIESKKTFLEDNSQHPRKIAIS